MALDNFSNNAQTTLAAPAGAGDATITVTSNTGFPTSAQFRILIDSEILIVTGGQAGLTWNVTRGNSVPSPDTTTSAVHNNGATVTHILTAGGLTNAILQPVSGALWANNTLLTLTTIANNYGIVLNGPAGAGTSFGIQSNAGTNSSDYAARFRTQANVDILAARGDGATVVGGSLNFSTAVGQIVPGATSLSHRNNANSADNLLISDAGLITLRNAFSVPYAASATLPVTGYGTVAVKIDDILVGTDSRYPSATGQITFLNTSNSGANLLPTGFRHLLVEWYARGDSAAVSQSLIMLFNNDGGANYDYSRTVGGNNTITNTTSVGQTSALVSDFPAANATANYFGSGEVKISHYQSAVGNKQYRGYSLHDSDNTAANNDAEWLAGKWRTTGTAITRLDLKANAGNFVVGSLFTLWGLP